MADDFFTPVIESPTVDPTSNGHDPKLLVRDSPSDTPRARPIQRSDVHHKAPSIAQRLVAVGRQFLTPQAEREEAALDERLRNLPSTSRTNRIVSVGPRGGVGKTTVTRAVGGALAGAVCGSVVLLDADRYYGPAATLAPDAGRSTKTIGDLLADFREPPHMPELRPYLSRLPDDLLILGAPESLEEAKALGPEQYERALYLLQAIDVVLLDFAGGIGGLQEWAIENADQAVLFTTPDFMSARSIDKVLADRAVTWPECRTLVLNNPREEGDADVTAVQAHFARSGFTMRQQIVLPYDHDLRVRLDKALYDLEGQGRDWRVPLKRLAATIGEGLL